MVSALPPTVPPPSPPAAVVPPVPTGGPARLPIIPSCGLMLSPTLALPLAFALSPFAPPSCRWCGWGHRGICTSSTSAGPLVAHDPLLLWRQVCEMRGRRLGRRRRRLGGRRTGGWTASRHGHGHRSLRFRGATRNAGARRCNAYRAHRSSTAGRPGRGWQAGTGLWGHSNQLGDDGEGGSSEIGRAALTLGNEVTDTSIMSRPLGTMLLSILGLLRGQPTAECIVSGERAEAESLDQIVDSIKRDLMSKQDFVEPIFLFPGS